MTIEDDEATVKGRCKRAAAKALKDLREHHGTYVCDQCDVILVLVKWAGFWFKDLLHVAY